ncbi:MAG: hypothetical protein C6I01_01290 [Epsilonproteobacteria bacterium]|jgi:hypothetical protein|nr:hypothetical protein [Campylobacterota bacterium]NPA89251.1 hypothetical protein [Campylobacterota bacterium]
MNYIYIFTGDNRWEERLKRGVELMEEKGLDPNETLFAVNDVKSIYYLRERGFKALNLDAPIDLFNLATKGDKVYLITPEENTLPLINYYPFLEKVEV